MEKAGLKAEDIFWKGDWNGMLWVKFAREADRKKGIDMLKECELGSGAWVTQDRPVEERAVGSFLLGFKRQLVEWGFDRREVQVDVESGFTGGGEITETLTQPLSSQSFL